LFIFFIIIVTLISTHWVLVTVPRAQPTQLLSTLQCRKVEIGGYQGTKQKAWTWTIVGAVHGECRTLFTLKTLMYISKQSWFELWCLTPLSTISQLYRGG